MCLTPWCKVSYEHLIIIHLVTEILCFCERQRHYGNVY
jgi:hypothetical protein